MKKKIEKIFHYSLHKFNEKITFPKRRNNLVKKLTPFLKESKSVLDLGSSDGLLAFQMSEKLPGVKFTGVDTVIQKKQYIKVIKYNGKKLPFKDGSFDSVMIVDVLHHDLNPITILKEAKRVARKNILIKDHFWNNKFDHMTLRISDYIGNKPYGIDLPFNYITDANWHKMIETLKLKVVEKIKYKDALFIHPQIILLLEKSK